MVSENYKKYKESIDKATKKYNKKHRDKLINWYKVRNMRLKLEVLTIIGRKCVCCGVTEWWNLTVDHIKPRKNKETTPKIYTKIIKNTSYRKKFQTMCYGCNNSKNTNKHCVINHLYIIDGKV